MANLQVKSIDDDLYESLGRRAASENRSISQEVVSILKEYLSTPSAQNKRVNQQFLALCGSWQGEETEKDLAEDILAARNNSNNHREIEF